jgi:hypothetical protein
MREFPEVDRAEWFIDTAKRKILKSQLGLLAQLEQALASRVITRVVSKTFSGFFLTLHTDNLTQCVNDFHQVGLSRHYGLD